MESYSTEMLKKAEAGNADEQHNLGKCYEYGNGVISDYKEAVMWYRKSAGQGNADAQCDLGFCYDKGKGVAMDVDEAVKWYTKAKSAEEQADTKAKEALEKLKSK